MQPPWIKFPHIHRASMGWRMGDSELYMAKYATWYGDRTLSERQAHQLECPEPEMWVGFYANRDMYSPVRS